MHTLLIVDDEKNICDGIEAAITATCPDIEIAAVLYSGVDAIQWLDSHSVDIVIADIRMDDKSGLDIAEFIKDRKDNTKVILITGYESFEYARSAINHGVSAFLTKPFASQELIDTVQEIVRQLDNENTRTVIDMGEQSLLRDWDYARHIVQRGFAGIWNSNELPLSRIKFFENPEPKVYEIRYFLKSSDSTQTGSNLISSHLDYFIDLGEFGSSDLLCFYCQYDNQELVFTAFSDNLYRHTLVKDFTLGISTKYHLTFSHDVKAFVNLNDYRKFTVGRGIMNQQFLSVVKTANDKKDIWDYVNSLAPEKLECLVCFLQKNYHSIFPKIEPGATLSQTVVDFVSNLFDIGSFKNTVKSALILKIIEYLDANYSNSNLSLSAIATEFSINQAYLSSLFKKAAGIGFNAYIQKLRMQNAMELLTETDLSISEIAAACGYSSLSYFSHAFKNYTGLYPVDYRNTKR